MNKFILIASLILTPSIAQTATLLPDQTYDINILADGISCFSFSDCSSAAPGSASYLTDNDADAIAAGGSSNPAFGSAIAADGLAGVMNILTTSDGAGGVNFTVNSFNADTYLGTSGGLFATDAIDASGSSTVGLMSGSIDVAGNILFDPTGRYAVAQFFTSTLGILPWNTGSSFTSGNQTNADVSLNGLALGLDGAAMIVSASEVGPAWGFKPGTSYTEIFSLQIVGGEIIPSAVPIPATFWLLGSGLLGLMGFARKNR